jgi:hypothetical protein
VKHLVFDTSKGIRPGYSERTACGAVTANVTTRNVTKLRANVTCPDCNSYISRAVNMHAELVEALREMVIANHGLPAKPDDEADPVVREALVKAVAVLEAIPFSTLGMPDMPDFDELLAGACPDCGAEPRLVTDGSGHELQTVHEPGCTAGE